MSAAATDGMALQTVAPLVRRGLTAEPSAGAYRTGISSLFVPVIERAPRCAPHRGLSASVVRYAQTPAIHGRLGEPTKSVELRCGAVALGRACLFPPLSSGGALPGKIALRVHGCPMLFGVDPPLLDDAGRKSCPTKVDFVPTALRSRRDSRSNRICGPSCHPEELPPDLNHCACFSKRMASA